MAAESSTAASGGSGGGLSAESYIGSLISLTSKSEIRYEGVLYNINTEESSIGLRNVRSFGTEGRKKDGQQVAPSDKIYEYILFRGSDIKDLQVKASAPVHNSPPINSDPAIIQSHYPRPTTPPTNLPAPPSGFLGDQGSHSTQMGLPGSTFQSGPSLYQQGANLNSWGPSPPNANGGGLAMPMYWPGFYGVPNGLPQMPQQTLLRPPPALSIPPSMQQMQFPGFSSSYPTTSQGLPTNNLQDYQSSLVVNSTNTSSTTSTLPASTLSLNMPSLQQTGSFESGPVINQLQNITPILSLSTSTPISSLPSSLSTTVPANAGLPSIASKPSPLPGPSALPEQNSSQPRTSLIGTASSALPETLTPSQPRTSLIGAASSVLPETMTPSLVTPGQLLQSGTPTVSGTASQPLQTTHKDVEVVQVSPKQAPETSAPVATEAQPPILRTPPNSRAHKPNGGAYPMRNNYRGRGGRGYGVSRPVTKFTKDFDFTAMNEKFNKDEVWGHLGKKSQSKDKEGNQFASDGDDSQDEDYTGLQNVESKAVYNKDDFFDSLSCNALDNDPNHGRTRYSEQMKLDTETFGEFSRYRGGRGGRGYNRGGGGRFRGSNHGRGYGGYGYGNRGHGGRGMQNRS